MWSLAVKSTARFANSATFLAEALPHESFGIRFSNGHPNAFLMRTIVLSSTSISPASIR